MGAGVEEWFEGHQLVTQHLKRLLHEAQKMMKIQADLYRSERKFE